MVDAVSVSVNGIRMNVLKEGKGFPLILLHGWPEFAGAWKRLMPLLSSDFTVIAPDFRGFGDSENSHTEPSDQVTADLLAEDLRALIKQLGLREPVGFVSHDMGAQVVQVLARRWPDIVAGLFFFNCPYPGIGARFGQPDHLSEIWYQAFHQKPWAASLVGQSRESIRIYFSAFLRHWSGKADAFNDEDIDQWVDNFSKPGNIQGGFNWYLGANATRLAIIRGEHPHPTVIPHPTRVLWGERDPVIKPEWMDQMPEYFSDIEMSVAPGCGHFVHFEDAPLAADEIRRFFNRIGLLRV